MYRKTIGLDHFNCSNCKSVYRIKYINGFICSGLVIEKHRSDAYRLCIKRHKRFPLDMKHKEVKDLAGILQNLLLIREVK